MARPMKTVAQYCLLSMVVMVSFRTLSVAEVHPETREGTVGFEMVGDLFANLAFEDLRKAG